MHGHDRAGLLAGAGGGRKVADVTVSCWQGQNGEVGKGGG